jgi:hypothetical protein
MRGFKGEGLHFSLNKCPFYTHDGASAKFITDSYTRNGLPCRVDLNPMTESTLSPIQGLRIYIDPHLKGLEDGFVIVGAACHLGGEEGHHLGEVHGAVSLIQHTLNNNNNNNINIRCTFFSIVNVEYRQTLRIYCLHISTCR